MEDINNSRKKSELTVKCLISLNSREGEYLPLDDLSAGELSEVKSVISKRVGECLSDYYSVHSEEYELLFSETKDQHKEMRNKAD